MTCVIKDVVLRDGLQDEPVVVPIVDRIAIAEALVAAGIREIEIASFVNPKRVPQMAGAEELVANLPSTVSVRYHAIALNARGVRRAVTAGVHDITVVTSASEGHSTANAGRHIDEAAADLKRAVTAHPTTSFTLGVSTAFVCPFDGEISAAQLLRVVQPFAETGIVRIGLADTIGTATPGQVMRSVRFVREAYPNIPIGLHLHNAHGQAFSTVDAALDAGITYFDASTGGYGGCPFAPGAHGNLATEQLVAHLHARGIPTGIDEAGLAEATDIIKSSLRRATSSQGDSL